MTNTTTIPTNTAVDLSRLALNLSLLGLLTEFRRFLLEKLLFLILAFADDELDDEKEGGLWRLISHVFAE